MKQLNLGSPNGPNDMNWVYNALRKIEEASRDPSAERIADDFTIEGTLTETKSLDVDSADASDIRAFLGTLVTAFKRRGLRRA